MPLEVGAKVCACRGVSTGIGLPEVPPSTVLLFLNEAEFTLTGLRLKDRAGFPLTAILWRQERGVF